VLKLNLLAVPALLMLGLLGPAAHAASLNVVDGNLLGASGVMLGDSLYDVNFVGGTCKIAFNGCDFGFSFLFKNFNDAFDASRALLSQVLIDGPMGSFGSEPSRTNGISLSYGFIYTPVRNVSGFVESAVIRNQILSSSDQVFRGDFRSIKDFSNDQGATLAVWSYAAPPSQVPLPPAYLLLLGGMVSLATCGCRSLRAQPEKS
jgi:hypothetical protein